MDNKQKFAHELARSHKYIKKSIHKSMLKKFGIKNSQERVLDEYYIEADRHKFDSEVKDYTTEWFVDNYYTLKMQLKRIRRELKNIPRDIPVLSDGVMSGFERVFAIAVEYVDFNGGVVTENGIVDFLNDYQESVMLTLDELWSLEAVFSLALARNIVTLASRRYESLKQSERVKRVAENIKYTHSLSKQRLDEYVNVSDSAMLANFILTLQAKTDNPDVLRWLDGELMRINLSANDVLEFSRRMESNCTFAIRNSITSLANINVFDWEGIFKAVSKPDDVLVNDPDGTYIQMDAKTKNIYRRKLKRGAKKLGISEVEYAEDVLYEAAKENIHIGNVLLRGYCKRPNIGKVLYLSSVWGITVLLLYFALFYLREYIQSRVSFTLTSVSLIIPMYMLSVFMVNYIATRAKRPTVFLRLDYEKGIPDTARTAVIIPALIPDKEQAGALVENMEVNYIANKDKNICFVLVGDYKDSDCEVMVDDEEIRGFTAELITELNKKYSQDIFFYMHRKRLYNGKHGRWFGWERKRGAVIQFNRFLANGDSKDFNYVSRGIKKLLGTKYVITLDADTKLPPGTAKLLVGTIDHPLNRPVVNAQTKRVISGYGILQPRMETSLPSAIKTPFAKIMSGVCGSEPYSSEISEVYQDVFGEGSFAGKGIYDSNVFCEVIDGRFPENAILSHDMIEGGYLNAGYVSDIVLVDDTPSAYIAHRKRAHRWMRGDWQLLCYLFGRVKKEDGKYIANTLSFISKYKILDNLIRTLFEPMLCLVLFAGIFVKELLWVGGAILLLYNFMPIVLELFNVLYVKLKRNERRRFNLQALESSLFNTVITMDKAVNNIDAVLRTVARLFTGKKLLEWQTAMQAEKGSKKGISYYYNIMQSSAAVGVVMCAFSVITVNVPAFAIGACFATAPLAAEKLGRVYQKPGYDSQDEGIIEDTARGAWAYFNELCTAENNFLPPDNFQVEPYKGAVTRTSPTNIGMMLCGTVAAEKLGFTTTSHAIDLIENVINTLQKLEKWNGHPYNWYDITSLKPLRPRFVSSADNGNLACCLIATREALLEYSEKFNDDGILQRLKKIIAEIKLFLDNMDVMALYDKKKDLFAVGFDVELNRLTEHAYDMLASEARQISFYAVITGAVSARHWTRLSRIVVKHSGNYILKSWSGSMFEYLMPSLLMKTYDNTLWSNVLRGVVREQIKYASRAKRLWGVSESGYWLFDENKYYQYKAFGIPLAAIRYTKSAEYVIAPYASALALTVEPKAAAKNLRRLKKLGMMSGYGFYEALDMSDNTGNIVRSHMAHHEGMSLLAAANVLKKDCMTDLFHKAPEVKAGEILLQERLPDTVSSDALPRATREKAPETNMVGPEERYNGVTLKPHCTMLSNGDMSVVISNSGANVIFCGDTLVNKWKSNDMTEHYGHFIFIKDNENDSAYSVTPSPDHGRNSFSTVLFRPEGVSFQKRVKGIESRLEINVAADKNSVIYSLYVKNTSNRTKNLHIADFLEPCLTSYEEYAAHPAYSDMFMESKYDENGKMIVMERTSKSTGNVKHRAALRCITSKLCDVIPMTSAMDFIGRNNNAVNAQFMHRKFNHSNSQNSMLYPFASLGIRTELLPGENTVIDFVLSYADNADELRFITDYFATPEACRRATELSLEHSKITVQYKRINKKAYRLINGLLSAIYYPNSYKIWMSSEKKSFLWQFGISGDVPIIYYEANEMDASGLKLLLKSYEYIVSGGVKADLVIAVADDGYHKDNYENTVNAVATSVCRDMVGKKNGIFILRKDSLSADCTKIAGFAVARFYSLDSLGIDRALGTLMYVRKDNISVLPRRIKKDTQKKIDIPKLLFYNGYGGFNENEREYTIILSDAISTPHPWSHVMANKSFGTLLTESGGGFTWYKNSRENKLTAWCNDTVADAPSEVLYVRDDASMQFITPTRLDRNSGYYTVTYGLGYAVYSHEESKLGVKETVFVPYEDNVKLMLVTLKNDSDIAKTFSLYYYMDVRLSPGVARIGDDIRVTVLKSENSVLAENVNMPENGYMFATCSGRVECVIHRKKDFMGMSGTLLHPAALDDIEHDPFDNSVPADCVVIKSSVRIKSHCKKTVTLMLGGVDNISEIQFLKAKYISPDKTFAALKQTKEYYGTMAPFKLTTNNKSLDVFFNNFLMYQVYVCRYMAKTSFYQCSGAYGFRDQLQDVLAFMYTDRCEARRHILRACSQQFEEGDVRHWWHEETGYGIRTKISDDMMFLPYVSMEYARFTGDHGIFNEQVPFVKGQEIQEGKETHFGKAYFSENTASLYEHCMRAIKRASRIGVHGLPLIGTGDWNDGFDKIGVQGKGESVWLAFFMHYVIENFKKISLKYGNDDDVHFIDEILRILKQGINKSAWDGKWYKRAYFDDGSPVGSESCDECKIDAIAQSWAAIADITPGKDIDSALVSADKYLVDEKNKLVKLFTPAFDKTANNPGYIKAYKSGVRENGGQYTHGAIWLAMAFARRGDAENAMKIINILNPVNHALTKQDADRYRVEPYVLAADVYSLAGNEGTGGWSWYTGSAAWMYKVVLEELIGIKISGDNMKIAPVVPRDMLPFRVEYMHLNNTRYIIDVISGNTDNASVDGITVPNGEIILVDDGKMHKIIVGNVDA